MKSKHFLALVLALPHLLASADPPPGLNLVVTGHSFHLPVMGTLDQVVKAAGIANHRLAARQMIGGSSVTQHWDLPDEKNTAKTALRGGGIETMTMSPNWVIPDPAIDQFVDLGLEKNPAMRFHIQVSWFAWDGMEPPLRVKANGERDAKTVADLRAANDPFRAAIAAQAAATNARLGREAVFLVPVGEAVLRLREKVISGEVPGVTKQSALFTDSIGHATPTVLQLAAYVQYVCLYRRDPAGLTCFETAGDEASSARNRLLQQIALAASEDEPMSGVKAGER
jgi:hypothetical protein